jgi:hypothetical protein
MAAYESLLQPNVDDHHLASFSDHWARVASSRAESSLNEISVILIVSTMIANVIRSASIGTIQVEIVLFQT